MAVKILVVSTDLTLQEDIHQSLGDSEEYKVVSTNSEEEALNASFEAEFDVLILDAEMGNIRLVNFIRELVSRFPNLILLVFPPGNNPQHPVLKGIVANGFLSKPFNPIEVENSLMGRQPISEETPKVFSQSVTSEEISSPGENNIDDLLLAAVEEDLEIDEIDIIIPEWLGESKLSDASQITIEPSADISRQPEQPPPLPWLVDNESPIYKDDKIFHPSTAPTVRLPDLPEISESESRDTGQSISAINSGEGRTANIQTQFSPSSLYDQPFMISPEVHQVDIEPLPSEPVSKVNSKIDPTGKAHGFRLRYTCVLIPRGKTSFLTKDLSARLGFILPQIHITNGWKLTGLSVRPTYLLWQISLPVSVSPCAAVDIIRKRTSSHFYNNFPQLVIGNESNDFWAPGYLILSGTCAPSPSTIQEFMFRAKPNGD